MELEREQRFPVPTAQSYKLIESILTLGPVLIQQPLWLKSFMSHEVSLSALQQLVFLDRSLALHLDLMGSHS